MKNKKNKNSFQQLSITISLMMLLFIGNSLGNIGNISLAQEDTQSISTVTPVEGNQIQINKETQVACQTKIAEWAEPEFEKYKVFMENHFSNKSKTSSLMEEAMNRYEKFKYDISVKYSEFVTFHINQAGISGANVGVQLVGLSQCESLVREYIQNANKLLQMRAITTAKIKKASVFVEKYQQINSKLRSLNDDFIKMVVNISTFDQKLPCYLKSCVQ